MHATDLLYVVIATAGYSRAFDDTILSLCECRLPNICTELLIVENSPKESTRDLLERRRPLSKQRYLHTTVPGKCHALNLAIQTIPSNALIVFTDDDIRFDSAWLCAYAEVAGKNPEGSFFGGVFGTDYQIEPDEALRPFLPASARGLTLEDFSAMPGRPFMGFNWAAYSGDLKNAGGFDEAIGPGIAYCSVGDEPDMQRRLRERGLCPVVVPNAKVWHQVPENRCSEDWLIKRSRQFGRSQGYANAKQKQVGLRFVKRSLQLARSIAFGSGNFTKRTSTLCERERLKGWFEGVRYYRQIQSRENNESFN